MPYPMTQARYLASGYTFGRREKLIFHSSSCWYALRLKKPARAYLTRDDAIGDNARPCLRCQP